MPDGMLPVFTVNTEEEAEALIVATCPMDMEGNYYSRELAQDQTLETLRQFSDKLKAAYEFILANRKTRTKAKRSS